MVDRDEQIASMQGATAELAVPDDLARAIMAWLKRGQAGPLERWFQNELSEEGVPRRLPVATWWDCLKILALARPGRPEQWPLAIDEGCRTILASAMRWSRPDGSTLFEPAGPRPDRGQLAWNGIETLGAPALETVATRWWPRKATRSPAKSRSKRPSRDHDPLPVAPPLPAQALAKAPLALLRPDWNRDGDLLAIDHRAPDRGTLMRLIAGGHDLLGPAWGGATRRAQGSHWSTGPFADVFEWTFRRDSARVTRSAILLRGRRMAILAEQVRGLSGPDADTVRIDLPAGVRAAPGTAGPVVRLESGRSFRAEVVALDQASDGASSLQAEESQLVWSSAAKGRDRWSALLVCWDRDRLRRGMFSRRLTVTERSNLCEPETALAFRVGWGQGESLVIYRSLGRPGVRACLGFQINARLLVATFSADGHATPLVALG